MNPQNPCLSDANLDIHDAMYLKALSLRNFRNFSNQDLILNPEFNFIFGRNAQGKTNLIEAIYYLSLLKSFRTSNRADLLTQGNDFAKLAAVFEKDELSWNIEVSFTSKERKVLLNGKSPRSRSEYDALIPIILFEPRHIYLFRESPSQRREYLNRAVYLQEPRFLGLWRDYEKVISQKNKILKERADVNLLDVWNERLADLGAQIVAQRLVWFDAIKTLLADEYKAISHAAERFHLIYHPAQNLLQDFASGAVDVAALRACLLEKIREKRREELDRRESLVGPHRDDFTALLGERNVGQFGSQGENRSALIALKLAQLKMFAQKFGKTPLFLLDDVASELDEKRCEYLFSYLRDENTQVFITTTENRIESAEFVGHSTRFVVEGGFVQAVG